MMSPDSRYFIYRPDANSFAGITFPEVEGDVLVSAYDSEGPLLETWKPWDAQGFEDNPPTEGDFPALADFNEFPVFSQRAWDVLSQLIGDQSEALPINHPSGMPYYLIHVKHATDCLDEGRSELERFSDGRVLDVDRYCLREDRVRGKHMIRLPDRSSGRLIVDDVFRQAVEAADLKGLWLRELPMV